MLKFIIAYIDVPIYHLCAESMELQPLPYTIDFPYIYIYMDWNRILSRFSFKYLLYTTYEWEVIYEIVQRSNTENTLEK